MQLGRQVAAVEQRITAIRADDIFATLKERILSWEYPPGYRFTEEMLCTEFGVSRSPVRETLRMLEDEGLVDKVPYKGCTVRQPRLAEIGELYAVRLILETAVVDQLAHQGLAHERAAPLYAQWQHFAAITDLAELERLSLASEDRMFHESLAEATGNRTLLELLRTINDRIHAIRMTDRPTVQRFHDTCIQHIQILDAITAGDAAVAREALRLNIEVARTHVFAALKEVITRSYLAYSVS